MNESSNLDWPLIFTNNFFFYFLHLDSKCKYLVKISTVIVTFYLKGLLIRKGVVANLFTSLYFSKSIINIKLFFKDDAGDYKPIGCVAATLNNSVLYKTHISCNHTVKYFVCKQSEYFFMGMFALFLPILDFSPLLIFSAISLRICNIINTRKISIKQRY
jgi:hypothetical protein